MVRIPAQAIAVCKFFEGFHKQVRRAHIVTAVPYVCPAGYWTIGYGRLCARDHPSITEAEGEAFLAEDMQTAVAGAVKYCPILLVEPDYRLAAIASFTFNLGVGRLQTSTLRRRINQGDWHAAGSELERWVNGGGKKLPGLVARRAAEKRLLLTGEWQ